jgi:lysophospholipase L1-like esterase
MGHGRRRVPWLIALAAMLLLGLPPVAPAYEGDQSCIDTTKVFERAKVRSQAAQLRVKRAKAALAKAIRQRKPHAVIRGLRGKLETARGELASARKAVAQARENRDASCQPQPGLYLSLGDSVAAGYGASASANSFVQLLYAHYQATLGVTQLSNLARPGETSGSIRSQGQLASGLAAINGPTDTRVVTIDIGGNDALQNLCADWSASSCALRSNVSATLADLQAALAADPGDERLIAMLYYNPGTGTASESSYDSKLLGANQAFSCTDTGSDLGVNEIIAQEAAVHGALVANPYPAFKSAGQSFIASDHLHPSDAGHAAIADAFEAAAATCP